MPPAAIIIASAITAGGALGAGALAKPKTTATQKVAEQESLRIAQAQEARAKELFDLGLPEYKNILDYYSKRVADPYKAALPDIETAARGTYGAERLLRSDMPRGGGLSAALAAGRLNLGPTSADIVRTTREGAAANVAGIAGNLVSGGQGGTAQAAATFASLLPRQQPSMLPGALSSAGSSMGNALMYWLMNRKSTPTVPQYPPTPQWGWEKK